MNTPMTTITVHGMGGGINFEMKIIELALREAGFNVEVENSADDWVVSSSEGWHEGMLERNLKNPETVKLIAKHIPWGG